MVHFTPGRGRRHWQGTLRPISGDRGYRGLFPLDDGYHPAKGHPTGHLQRPTHRVPPSEPGRQGREKHHLPIMAKPTQFGRAMRELGVTQVFAHSPEAKGRVERANGTFQDRLVSELRLAGASTIE